MGFYDDFAGLGEGGDDVECSAEVLRRGGGGIGGAGGGGRGGGGGGRQKGDAAHSGAFGGQDSGFRVLDNPAVLRAGAEGGGGSKEDFGVGFAHGNIVAAHSNGEEGGQGADFHYRIDLFVGGRGGQGEFEAGGGEAMEEGVNAADEGDALGCDEFEEAAAFVFHEGRYALGKVMAFFYFGEHLGAVGAEVGLVFVGGYGDSEFIEDLGFQAAVEGFGVDDYSVHVEDYR